jgi:hypothetical protein
VWSHEKHELDVDSAISKNSVLSIDNAIAEKYKKGLGCFSNPNPSADFYSIQAVVRPISQ